MKKTFFAALAAMLIFAVAGPGNVFAGGKITSTPEKAKVVTINKTEKVSTKTTTVSGEKKMVKRHHKAHKAHAIKKEVK